MVFLPTPLGLIKLLLLEMEMFVYILRNHLISNHLGQLKNEPTQVRDDGFQSCIDLICTDQPFLFTETGVLSSLDTHTKHNIPHGTLNMGIPPFPIFKRKIRDYKSAKIDHIRFDLQKINWHDIFLSLNFIGKKLSIYGCLFGYYGQAHSNLLAKFLLAMRKMPHGLLQKSKLQSNVIIGFKENG